MISPPDQLPLPRNPTNGELVLTEPGESVAAGFFDVGGFGLACQANEFDQKEEIDMVIRMIRDNDVKTSLAALKHFHSLKKDIAATSGMIGTRKLSTFVDETGVPVVSVVSETRSSTV